MRITVDRSSVGARISPLTCGINMEDLHYQINGGIYSQLIHGESFFEPSHDEYARRYEALVGFANTEGRLMLEGNSVQLAADMRLTSEARCMCAGCSVESEGCVELAICVSELNAYDRPEWYAGYALRLGSDNVELTRAGRANRHEVVARCQRERVGGRVALELALADDCIVATIDGVQVFKYADADPLPAGSMAVRGSAGTRIYGIALDGVNVEIKPRKADGGVSMRWKRVCSPEATAEFELCADANCFPGVRSQLIRYIAGRGEAGVLNGGLCGRGIALVAGRPYEGHIRLRSDMAQRVALSLRDMDSHAVLARCELEVTATDGRFEMYDFELLPSAAAQRGSFVVALEAPGEVYLGYVYLSRGEWGRYAGLPARRELAQAMIDQGARLLRFNGGMIECEGYRYSNMELPRAQRMPYDGFYDRYCSSGWGVLEHVMFCARAGMVPVVGLNIDESPQDVARFVRYCRDELNAPLQYYQVANETPITEDYVARFKRVAQAVWQVEPDITLIPAGMVYRPCELSTRLDAERRLGCQLELTRFVKSHGKRILWDAHSFNTSDDVAEALDERYSHILGAIAMVRWLRLLLPGVADDVHLAVLELNAGRYDHLRGLSHACELNLLHANSDIVSAAALPNATQPWGIYQTDWKAVLWTQGNIYYDKDSVWYQSAHYVARMVSEHWMDAPIGIEHAQRLREMSISALCGVSARKPNELVARVVNYGDAPMTLEFDDVSGDRYAVVGGEVLSGPTNAVNTRSEQRRIAPKAVQAGMRIELPAHSFGVYSLQPARDV